MVEIPTWAESASAYSTAYRQSGASVLENGPVNETLNEIDDKLDASARILEIGSGAWRGGRPKLLKRVEKQIRWESGESWAELSEGTFDLIISLHGLYLWIEALRAECVDRAEYTARLRNLLRGMLDLLNVGGELLLVHSSRFSPEKEFRYSARVRHHVDEQHFRRFDGTWAEELHQTLAEIAPVSCQDDREELLREELDKDDFWEFNLRTGDKAIIAEARKWAIGQFDKRPSVKAISQLIRATSSVRDHPAKQNRRVFAAAKSRPLGDYAYFKGEVERVTADLYRRIPGCDVFHLTFSLDPGRPSQFEQHVEAKRVRDRVQQHLRSGVLPVGSHWEYECLLYPLCFRARDQLPNPEHYPLLTTPDAMKRHMASSFTIRIGECDGGPTESWVVPAPPPIDADQLVHIFATHSDTLSRVWEPDDLSTIYSSKAVNGLPELIKDLDGLFRQVWDASRSSRAISTVWQKYLWWCLDSPFISDETDFDYYVYLRSYLLDPAKILYVPIWSASSDRLLLSAYLFAELIDNDSYVIERLRDLANYIESSHSRQREFSFANASARAALMSRNLSHNIGSHSMANPELLRLPGIVTAKLSQVSLDAQVLEGYIRDIREYFGYIQQRLDFIASALSEGPLSAEPILLKAELWERFRRQKLLLRTIVDGMELDETAVLADSAGELLVGIPNGFVGCHALYVVVENIIRNAAKYGRPPNAGEPWLRMNVVDRGKVVDVTLVDYCSTSDGETLHKITKAAEAPLIGTHGRPEFFTHGIAEMKQCVSFLNPRSALGPQIHDGHLAYSFRLQRPRMLTLVGKPNLQLGADSEALGVQCYDLDDDEAYATPCQIAAIDCDAAEANRMAGLLASNFLRLPFRVLLLGDSADRVLDLAHRQGLPSRRVVTATRKINISDPRTMIIETLQQWMVGFFRPPEGRFQLCVSYEMEPSNSWKRLKNTNLTSIDAAITIGTQVIYRTHGWQRKFRDHVVLCHHAKSDPGLKNVAVVHPFGKLQSLSLFRTLAHLPEEQFLFDWLIMSLVDSMLLRVVIVDERIAERPNAAWSDRVYVVRSVRKNGQRRFLSDAVEKRVTESGGAQQYGELDLDRCIVKSAIGGRSPKEVTADCIIVHEGVLDVLERHHMWSESDFQRLLQIAPVVIRTSGRGAEARHGGADLPFIEFSQLSATILQDTNKHQLGRMIFGSSTRR